MKAGSLVRHKRLYLQFRNKELGILIQDDKELIYETFSLIETSKKSLIAKLESLRKNRVNETYLILPREEVLSQDFEIAASSESIKKTLYQKLEKAFPCRVEELSYGVRISEELGGQVKGSLVATTNEKLKEFINPIEEAGLQITDIISSDETLLSYWLSNPTDTKKCLLIDINETALEALLIADGKIKFSRVFKSGLEDLAKEIDLLTLEYEAYEKIYLAGPYAHNFLSAAKNQFQVPVEILPMPQDSKRRSIPCSIHGVIDLREKKYLSLLPTERKQKKRALEKKKAIITVSVSFLIFIVATTGFFLSHQIVLTAKLTSFDKKITKMDPNVESLKKMYDSIIAIDQNDKENKKILSILKELSIRLPAGVSLTRLSMDNSKLFLQGQSIDNSSIADSLAIFKNIDGFMNPKLDYALKKSDGKDIYFEFVLTAERAHE